MITWLVSYPKSGNTWVRALIAAYLRDGPVDLGNITGTESDAHFKWYQCHAPKALETMPAREQMYFRYAGLYNMAMTIRPPAMVKTHSMFCNFHGMPMFPSGSVSKAFYVVRDPRDVVISLTSHLGIKDMDEAVALLRLETFILNDHNRMPIPVGHWSNHYGSWKGAMPEENPLNVIRYEDLITAPHTVVKTMLEHWGVPVDESRIERAVMNASFDQLQRAEKTATDFTEKSKHANHFFRVGKMDQWKQRLTNTQVSQIEKDHGPAMQELGYKFN